MLNDDGWVRISDLTPEVIQGIENTQRRQAARWGELGQWDKDYAARRRQVDRDERAYGNR